MTLFLFGLFIGWFFGAGMGIKLQDSKIAKGHAIYIDDEEYRAAKVTNGFP